MVHVKLKNNQELIIREAEKDDAEELIISVKKIADETTFLTFEADEFTLTKTEEEKIIAESHASDNRIFLLAILNDKIVGFIKVDANQKKRCKHLASFGIGVLKEHWNKGIAKHLIQEMLKWAKGTQILRKINLGVQSNNLAGIHLYKKMGFQEEGTERRGALIYGEFYDVILMGLLID